MVYILVFALFFVGHGIYFSALSPYTHSSFGADAYLVILAGQVCFPVGYFLGGVLSDRTRRLRSLVVPSLLVHGPIQFLLFSFPDQLWLTMALSGATRFLFAVNFQLITIAVLEGAGMLRFGRFRAAGTVSFFVLHAILFWIEWQAPGAEPGGLLQGIAQRRIGGVAAPVGLISMWATALACLLLQAQRRSKEAYYFRDALAVVRRPQTLFFLVLSFFFFFGYQLVDFHLGRWLQLRGGMRDVYAAWMLAVVLEIPFLPLTGLLARRYGVHSLIYISLIAAFVRFAYLSGVAGGLALPSPVYSQILHGLHFTGYYMGALLVLRTTFPEHLFGTGNGMYMVLCPSLGGMAGNIFYGRLLYQAGNADFFPLFFTAAVLQVLLVFGFLFLPAPTERSRTHETS